MPGSGPTTGDFVWTVEASGRTEPVTAIWGASATDVWAASAHGVVHSRGDGVWATLHEDTGANFSALFGAAGSVFVGGTACSGGICQGGVVERSSDDGATWSTQSLGDGVMSFSAAGADVYAESGKIYVSTDGFMTSTAVPGGFATSYGLFADGGALYDYGGLRGSQIRRTTDNGQTWTTVYSGFSGSQSGYMNALTRGTATMFALANGCNVPKCVSALFRSVDGGTTWTQASWLPNDYAAGLWAASDTELFVGGSSLIRSTDGGATFTKVTLPVDGDILALWAASTNELYAVGMNGTILHGRR